MKKIDNCENSTVLVALLLAGILLVMGAYRLFSWLCSRGLTDTLTWVLGAAALVLAALGLLLLHPALELLVVSPVPGLVQFPEHRCQQQADGDQQQGVQSS